jgi:hypothetical protein
MKRLIHTVPFALSLACVLVLLAQSPRDSYRSAYAVWRQADPNLERDAASPQTGFAERVKKVAEAAAVYGRERVSFLKATARPDLGALAEPFNPEIDLSNGDLRAFATAETKTVETSIKRFENDRDPGIVQWRQALERERAALANLNAAIVERQAATAKAATPMASAEASRMEAVAAYAQFDAALLQAADIQGQEATAWAQYYRILSAAGSPPVPVSRPPEVVPPLPLVRYTGTWSFPISGGVFAGAKPEFIDLAVHEEGGQWKGSFYGRFTVAPGVDPVLRFDFSGAVSSNRTQSLKLQTAEGAKGTLELIPGAAFNLLEVNFHTDPIPGKLQQGNMVLLKK